jgi:hypothetical protein
LERAASEARLRFLREARAAASVRQPDAASISHPGQNWKQCGQKFLNNELRTVISIDDRKDHIR